MKITQETFNATLQQIKEMIDQGQWLDAHRSCIEVLRFDPENIKVIRLKNKIEKKVRKINIEAIKSDMKQLMPLWKAKNYPALMENIRLLAPYIDEYKPLKKFALAVEKEYQNFVLAEQEKNYHQDIGTIKDLIGKKQFQEGIRLAEKLRIQKMHLPEVYKLISDLRKKWVDYEIECKRALLNTDKWEDIILFYQGLLRIDGKSAKIKNLIEKAKKHSQMKRIEEKRDYIYSGLEKIKTLFQLKKYESAMIAANEIIMVDPENKKAGEYADKAKIKVARLIDKELIQQMKSSIKKNKQDYRLDKKNYIKL